MRSGVNVASSFRSMRENLIFEGIPQGQTENAGTVENVVRSFMIDTMKIPQERVDNISIDRIHRFSQSYRGKPRRIVAKFTHYKDKEEVCSFAKNLKDSEFFVYDQYPPEIQEQRRRLVQIMKEKKRQDPSARVKLVYNKLYVNGTLMNPT